MRAARPSRGVRPVAHTSYVGLAADQGGRAGERASRSRLSIVSSGDFVLFGATRSFQEGAMDTTEVLQQMFRDGMARLGASVNVITSDGISGRLAARFLKIWSFGVR